MQSVPITTNVLSLNPAHARCVLYNIMAVSFIGGGNCITQRKPVLLRVTYKLTHIMLYQVFVVTGIRRVVDSRCVHTSESCLTLVDPRNQCDKKNKTAGTQLQFL